MCNPYSPFIITVPGLLEPVFNSGPAYRKYLEKYGIKKAAKDFGLRLKDKHSIMPPVRRLLHWRRGSAIADLSSSPCSALILHRRPSVASASTSSTWSLERRRAIAEVRRRRKSLEKLQI